MILKRQPDWKMSGERKKKSARGNNMTMQEMAEHQVNEVCPVKEEI